MVHREIHEFTPEHKKYLVRILNFYNDVGDIQHSIKVSWLNGMLKQTHYDAHQRNMLNKMVKKYNEKLV